MENKQLDIEVKNSGRAIGGWLWLIMLIIVANGLQILIDLVNVMSELLSDDWRHYFQSADEILRTRINIYFYLIISKVTGMGILIWSLLNFFQRKKKFPASFLALFGYFILTEVLRVYFLDYYAELTNQAANNMDSSLLQMGIVTIIAGLYLNKGKRPNQTFVNLN